MSKDGIVFVNVQTALIIISVENTLLIISFGSFRDLFKNFFTDKSVNNT